jgi:hypothetical protein
MANRLLSEPQAMNTFVGLLYDLLRTVDSRCLLGGETRK